MLLTPGMIRRFQRKLYAKAKQECACFGMKNIGKPCTGKPYARFDEGGQVMMSMVRLLRHRQTKGAETDRSNLGILGACSLLYPRALPRVISGSAAIVVFVAKVKGAEVEFVIDQMTERMLETAGNDLTLKIDRQKLQTFVRRFVPRHADLSAFNRSDQIMPRSQSILRFFYSLNVKLRGASLLVRPSRTQCKAFNLSGSNSPPLAANNLAEFGFDTSRLAARFFIVALIPSISLEA